MKRNVSLIRALMAGTALVLLATAAQSATTTGVVVSSDTATNVVTIRTDDGRKLSFLKNDATTFEGEGTSTSFTDVVPGARITVTSAETPTDTTLQLLASHVRIDEAAEAPVDVAASDEMERSERAMANRLPSTGTPLPILTLAALASIMAGVGLRLRR